MIWSMFQLFHFRILFADDTSVYIEADKESDLIKTLNEELAKLNIWLDANKLPINIAKHYMVFHRGRRKSICFVYLCGAIG